MAKGNILHDNITVGDNGRLHFSGMDTVELAKKHATPLYLIDEDKLRQNCREFKAAVEKHFGAGSLPLFASKSLCYLDLYRVIKDEGLGTDVVSGGELYTALKAGFPTDKIFFHGNNKTDSEIEFALSSGVGHIVADNREEIDTINSQALSRGTLQKILLRLSPGIDPHTHKAVATGSVDSKFGAAIETGQAEELILYAMTLPGLSVEGVHCHIGSQIFEHSPFSDAAKTMLAFMLKIKTLTGRELRILNLGGGVGVRYVESHPEISIDTVLGAVKAEIDAFCTANGVKRPQILFEMGRFISANAGMTLYTVGSFKTITGYKNYVSVDGGMTDNPRYALYQSPYTAVIADRAGEEKNVTATIAGRCCESGDLIQEDAPIQPCKKGDTLAVLVTGAYNQSMSSHYNRLPKPALVVLSGGKDRVAVKRESYEDMLRNEV